MEEISAATFATASMSRPAKRARTDGDAVTAYSPEQLTEMLTSLTANAQAKMLVEAAAAHPDIAAKIASAHRAKTNRDQAKAAREAARPQNFWPHYDKAFDQMYVKHERLSDSRQEAKGFDVASGIEQSLQTIASKTTAECPYETKISAIDTMREIFLLIDGNGRIPRVVRQNTYDWGSKLIRVIETFSPEELDRLRKSQTQDKGPGSWMKLFEETVKIARSYCIEDDLQTDEAWNLLTGGA
ncbi:hypothetical protein CONLIGDRAFT_637922 [Coniochaeta ligniaria NRRL 30616]|uniref:Uncharacterized protein n=1 Tax=Coniochaeta ligniaria NRRL 30616 TaxID=1408157 RepID=A0A1J7IZD9_9PEZI|nr:hypothetical protein CONLIGDRAFT_637922 [Coniochaeta ligniaria NRRL 30616]